MRIFVVGASGLVGQNVVRIADDADHAVRGTYRTTDVPTAAVELDKTDREATREAVAEFDPDLVVDTAAFHAVDDCETERGAAFDVNARGTRHAAEAADAVDAHYVYLSTDYVFAGDDDGRYIEDDSVDPVNYYGETKYAGEIAALSTETATVLRPSVVYGSASDNFVTWVRGELAAGNEVGIVDDQVSTPTYAPDLARACVAVGERDLTGVYHAAGPESLSRYEFTLQLAEVYGFKTSLIDPITSAELGQEAPRPADSSLDSGRLYDESGVAFHPPAQAFEQMSADVS